MIMGHKLTTEEFIERAKVFHSEYDYSKVVYVNSHTKVCIICPIHGEFYIQAYNIGNSGHGCPKCAKEQARIKFRHSEQEIESKIKDQYPGYTFKIDNYINENSKIQMTCSCGYTYRTAIRNVWENRQCRKCASKESGLKQRMSQEEFINRAKLLYGNTYDYSKTVYTKSADKVTITCPEHGDFQVVATNHLQGIAGCPVCSSSIGEQLVRSYLLDNKIDYIPQYKIDYPKYKFKTTRIDFYVPEFNTFIEVNGAQHYYPIYKFGGETQLQKQQKRDQYVSDYCSTYGIKLIIINYNQKKNISKILNKEFYGIDE